MAPTRRVGALLLMAVLIALGQEAAAGSLDRIRQDKTLRIAYREDAPPFSYKNNIGEPAGFMVDLCRAVAKKLTQQLQLPALSVIYIPVTAANRFEAIQQNKADLLLTKTHAEGLGLLDNGTIAAYFADRDILTSLVTQSKEPGKIAVAENYLTVEPYALALPRGDEEFRLAVDRALSHIYRSGEIGPIFQQNFSGRTTQSPMLQALYVISGLPD
jgi:ABC-type amino acid transport substrate-binding protein